MNNKKMAKEAITNCLNRMSELIGVWDEVLKVSDKISEEATPYVTIDDLQIKIDFFDCFNDIKRMLLLSVDEWKIELTKEMVEDVFKKYDTKVFRSLFFTLFKHDIQTLMESFKYKRQKRA